MIEFVDQRYWGILKNIAESRRDFPQSAGRPQPDRQLFLQVAGVKYDRNKPTT